MNNTNLNPWVALGYMGIDGAMPMQWLQVIESSDAYLALKRAFLKLGRQAESFFCEKCGYDHSIVCRANGSIVGAITDVEQSCTNIEMTEEEITTFHADWPAIAEALCKVLGYRYNFKATKRQTFQIGVLPNGNLVYLTVPSGFTPSVELLETITEMVTSQPKPFLLLIPTLQ